MHWPFWVIIMGLGASQDQKPSQLRIAIGGFGVLLFVIGLTSLCVLLFAHFMISRSTAIGCGIIIAGDLIALGLILFGVSRSYNV